MALSTLYYSGGFLAIAPAQNKQQESDSTAATFTTWDVNGVQTSQRSLTSAEIAQFAAATASNTAATNQASLLTKAANALAANATYQAIATPTQAQAVAQVGALTAQVNALIRLAANQLASTSGT